MKGYQILYNDGLMIRYDLTEAEFDQLTKDMTIAIPIFIGEGKIIRLDDIRHVVEITEAKTHSAAEPDMTPEQREWIRMQEKANMYMGGDY